MVRISPFLDGRTVKLMGWLVRRPLRRRHGVDGAGRKGTLASAGMALINSGSVAKVMQARKAEVAAIAATVDGLTCCGGHGLRGPI